MSNTARKNYIGGSGKIVENKYGPLILFSLKKEDLMNLPEERGYVKIIIAERKEEGKYGETHYAYENQRLHKNDDAPQNEEPKGDQPPF